MKTSLTLLISSAGRRVELLRCFREDAAELGVSLRVIATDTNPGESAACRMADLSVRVPRCDDPGFVEALLQLCRAEGVDLLVPTIDPELLPLSAARGAFAAAGTWLSVSDPQTVALARNKLETARFLANLGIATPRSLPAAEWLAEPGRLRFPVILKPVDGSGSRGLREIRSPEEATTAGIDSRSLLAQERCRGREFTVNLYFDRTGRCRAAVPHERLEVRAGEVSKGRTTRHAGLLATAAGLARNLAGARGAFCFQAMVDDPDPPVTFEFNARFGGGYPLAHRAGARFTRWLLEDAAGRPSTARDEWTPDLLMLRYDTAVFLPAVP